MQPANPLPEKYLSIFTYKNSLIILLATIIAAIIRWYSSFDNLWLDEIWSANFTVGVKHVWDIFSIHHDNNNILNTIYLYYFGHGPWWPQYRIHSIIAGTAAVSILSWLGFRKGFLEGVITAIFSTISFSLVIHSAEARGYALATLFSITAFAAFQNYGQKTNPYWVFIFWISTVLGMLSHLTFIYIFFAFGITSLFYNGYKITEINRQFKTLMFWYLVPSMSILFFLLSRLNMEVGGGDSIYNIFTKFSLFIFSAIGTQPGIISFFLGLGIFISVGLWIYKIEKKTNPLWLFYVVTLFLVPAIRILMPLQYFYARHLGLTLPFFYLILASILATGIRRFNITSLLCFIFIGLFIFENTNLIKNHLEYGRGNYLPAISHIINKSIGPTISITSDQDFRNNTLIKFYSQFVKSDKKIEYINQNEQSADKNYPEWIIHHSLNPLFSPPQKIYYFDKEYQLESTYRHADIVSGWSWFFYHQ